MTDGLVKVREVLNNVSLMPINSNKHTAIRITFLIRDGCWVHLAKVLHAFVQIFVWTNM